MDDWYCLCLQRSPLVFGLPAVAEAIPPNTEDVVVAATPGTSYGVFGRVTFTLAVNGVPRLCVEAVHVEGDIPHVGCFRIDHPQRGPDGFPLTPNELTIILRPDGFQLDEDNGPSERQPLSALAGIAASRRLPNGSGVAALLVSVDVDVQTFVAAADALAASFPHLQIGSAKR